MEARVQARSSFEWKQRYSRELWRLGYFEHVLRDEEDTVAVARYILGNPVRAGMVSSPEEYPFLGSMTMAVRDLLLFGDQVLEADLKVRLYERLRQADLKVRLYECVRVPGSGL